MKTPSAFAPQRGAALIVALLLLVVMTLLGLSGVRMVMLEERMTANAHDRGLAFQAAEAALRVGEAVAQSQAAAIPPNQLFPDGGEWSDSDDNCAASPCANGLCAQPDKDCPARWLDDGFDGWVDAGELDLGPLGTSPQYFVEFLGGNFPCDIDDPTAGATDCNRYRVTARSHGDDDRAIVILQSIYATE
ncbi:PilX N-terminal domain-containing pilus assembly protein [Azoarcus olearius]|uniref:Tfp pilus assembly protein n=1 Tax=Azoarcus sp. (strain BH72) TaxID=418699 RepID=A1K9M7_AZOSB|nr:PilX N-terminal domain-containing pilus assembly protein [Azoarcus olearius]CAL95532.1 putative Tfp pilus assembly protein [Azoarcus olearius]